MDLVRSGSRYAVVAVAFGVTLALLKGDGYGIREAAGNLSAPWVLLPLWGGRSVRKATAGAVVGLCLTLLALAAFYVTFTAEGELGGHGFLGDLSLVLRGNQKYFALGVVSGLVSGAFGVSTRSWRRGTLLLLVGAVLLGEPIVTALVAAINTLDRLAGGVSTPSRVPYLCELGVGLCIVLRGSVQLARRTGAADPAGRPRG